LQPIASNYFGIHITFQQPRTIPAGHKIKPMPRQDRAQQRGIAREFMAKLKPREAGLLALSEADFERRGRAQFRHVIIGPGERIDPKTNTHDQPPSAWLRRFTS